MKRQILKFYNDGQYTIIRDDEAKVNPYRIYFTSYEFKENRFKKSKKQIARYGNLSSCMRHLYDITYLHDKE